MGEERLTALLQESLAATRLGAAKPADFRARIVVHRAGEGHHLSDRRKADASRPRAAGQEARCCAAPVLCAGRQVRADQASALCPRQQFKRANRQLKRLRTMLGAVIRDITRKIAGRPELMAKAASSGTRPGTGGNSAN